MELIYSMRRKPLKCEPPHFDSSTDPETVRPICTISTANIIAFSSPTELSDVDGDTWGGHVYVCDLDTPWNSFKVASTSHPVSALEWDIEGKQLLIATSVGDVSVWGQREFLLNDWQCLYTTSFPGEHIIKGAFFHNGRRVIVLDKKPEAPITDRIQSLRSTPTLKGFGGVPLSGVCVVTATGLAGAALARSGAAPAAAEPLRPARDHVTAASIAYKNGNLLLACVCGRAGASCVRVFICSVRASPAAPAAPGAPPAPALALQPLPATYLLGGGTPVSISWSLREDTDSLLIAGTSLTLWKCTERAHPVHKLLSKGPLQGSTTPGGGQKPGSDSFNTVVWQKTAVWPLDGEVAVSVCGARLPLGAPHAALATGRALHLAARDSHHVVAVSVCGARLPLGAPHAALATGRALHLAARDSHHVLCSRPVITSGTPGLAPEAPAAAASPPKKPKYGPGVLPTGAPCATVSHVEMSSLGGVVVCVDTHAQLHVYKLPQPWGDIPTPMAIQHATTLLEYSMVTGYDCLDVLLTLKPNIIEPLYERLTETFLRQPPAFQQYYYHSCLKLRIALCRLSPPLQSSASSLSCVQMCCATLAACSAALRDERSDAPPIEDDDDKNLAALEAKPELISEALPLRLGLQRARDIALTCAAQIAHAHHPHGCELWSEPAALCVLRKLVVVWRACAGAGGRGGGDALSRLLARLHHHVTRHELLDECSALGMQSNAPRVWDSLPRCSVSAPHGKPAPLYLEYGVEPEYLRYIPEAPAYAQSDNVPPLAMDSIRYMYLGGGAAAARWRECGRCGTRALPAAHSQRHPLQRAHDARFLPACRCGGKWSLCKNT